MASKEKVTYWMMVTVITLLYAVLMFWGVRLMLWFAGWMGEFNFCYLIAALSGLRVFYEGFRADRKVVSNDYERRGL